jgi:hypothetical protein
MVGKIVIATGAAEATPVAPAILGNLLLSTNNEPVVKEVTRNKNITN